MDRSRHLIAGEQSVPSTGVIICGGCHMPPIFWAAGQTQAGEEPGSFASDLGRTEEPKDRPQYSRAACAWGPAERSASAEPQPPKPVPAVPVVIEHGTVTGTLGAPGQAGELGPEALGDAASLAEICLYHDESTTSWVAEIPNIDAAAGSFIVRSRSVRARDCDEWRRPMPSTDGESAVVVSCRTARVRGADTTLLPTKFVATMATAPIGSGAIIRLTAVQLARALVTNGGHQFGHRTRRYPAVQECRCRLWPTGYRRITQPRVSTTAKSRSRNGSRARGADESLTGTTT
ncbi:MAG: hypothetical protein QOE58_3149 [Actinomycetota bacterium]|nr:hypothetical protein [Actinomycetota bacterium]